MRSYLDLYTSHSVSVNKHSLAPLTATVAPSTDGASVCQVKQTQVKCMNVHCRANGMHFGHVWEVYEPLVSLWTKVIKVNRLWQPEAMVAMLTSLQSTMEFIITTKGKPACQILCVVAQNWQDLAKRCFNLPGVSRTQNKPRKTPLQYTRYYKPCDCFWPHLKSLWTMSVSLWTKVIKVNRLWLPEAMEASVVWELRISESHYWFLSGLWVWGEKIGHH